MMDVPIDEQELPEPVRLRAICLVPDLEGYLEGYQRTASPRPEGELRYYLSLTGLRH